MRHRFPYVGADLPKPVLQQAFSEHCETTVTGWCITRHACLLSQLSLGTYFSLNTEGRLRLSRMGAWFCAEVVYRPKTVTHSGTNRACMA